MKRPKWLVIAVAIAALSVVSVVYAAPASRSTSDVHVFPAGPQLEGARSTLVRNDNGMSMTFHTSGLEPGTVATVWWAIFHHPELCFNPGNCTGADVNNDAQVELVDISVFYATGHVIGGSGKANYGAHLPVGRLTVDPDPSANQLIRGDGVLKDARGADVHLVIRTHGPAIPGLINHQLSTFDAGCTTAPPALQGPNTCMNIQVSVHEAP
jgi:hypothetical protein